MNSVALRALGIALALGVVLIGSCAARTTSMNVPATNPSHRVVFHVRFAPAFEHSAIRDGSTREVPMQRKAFVPLVFVLAAGAAFAQQPQAQGALTEAQVRATLQAQGYTKVNDVKFEDGVWKADARSADGNRVDVRMDAKTGEIFPDEQVANLTEDDVRARLAAAGYVNVHDVDYEDGIWNAEGEDAEGKDVELKIDPKTGKVIGKEKD